MNLPRILIGAPSSGSGKTLVTCGILQALVNRGLKVASFKCGPDYIDPLFHSRVIGTKSRNLDGYLSDEETLKYLFVKNAREVDLSVMEGVMGYYDGVDVHDTQASSYELARMTKTPAILVVDCKGMGLSAAAIVKGFMDFREDSRIAGVIFNQLYPSLYPAMKKLVEEELSLQALGYVPYVKDLVLESRHLGLIMPDEIKDLSIKLQKLAMVFEETIDIDGLIKLANRCDEIEAEPFVLPKMKKPIRIAIARDEAFCFYYQDNLDLLEEMGAELIEFSPLHDQALPKEIQAMILGGGYPELFAKELSDNSSMITSMKQALEAKLPCLAECGGFMYLHQEMEGIDGKFYPMVGMISGKVYKTDQLKRFGYIGLSANVDQLLARQGEKIRGHEFHYYESDSCGNSFTAIKPITKKEWTCIHGNEHLGVGFPHLYYYSNVNMIYRFLERCV